MSAPGRLPSGASSFAAGEPGTPTAPFPGDTHWYDLPDDDAAPEEDEGGVFGRFGRWLR
ncbi:hypothetical protein [Microbispora sp. H10830]|uniref:hypothetical protein n=1 Tax=Microbispora sp. H10830 TaxID=2729109 RepID=UPI0016019976|nr:hypothetical protein [Microbispora sp. H10830]